MEDLKQKVEKLKEEVQKAKSEIKKMYNTFCNHKYIETKTKLTDYNIYIIKSKIKKNFINFIKPHYNKEIIKKLQNLRLKGSKLYHDKEIAPDKKFYKKEVIEKFKRALKILDTNSNDYEKDCLEEELCRMTNCLEKLKTTNECSQCHSEVPKEAKFCQNCGCSIYNWDNPNPDTLKMVLPNINKTEEQKLCDELIKEEQKLKKNELLNKIHTSTGTSYFYWDGKDNWYSDIKEEPYGIVDPPKEKQWICSYYHECSLYDNKRYICNYNTKERNDCNLYENFTNKYQTNPKDDVCPYFNKCPRFDITILRCNDASYERFNCNNYKNYENLNKYIEQNKQGKCPYYDKCPSLYKTTIKESICQQYNFLQFTRSECKEYQKFKKEKERHACAECDLFNNNICEGFNIPAYGDTTGFCLKFKFREKEKEKQEPKSKCPHYNTCSEVHKDLLHICNFVSNNALDTNRTQCNRYIKFEKEKEDLCEYYDTCNSSFKMDCENSWCWNEYIKSREKYCGTYKKFINNQEKPKPICGICTDHECYKKLTEFEKNTITKCDRFRGQRCS